MSNKKEVTLNEHINELKYRFGYNINETPRYKQVIDDSMEFDEVPEVNSTMDGQPMPNAGGGTDAYLGEVDVPNPEEETPAPEGGDMPAPEGEVAPTPAPEGGGEVPPPVPEEPVDGGEVPPVEPEGMPGDVPGEMTTPETPQPNPEKEVNQMQNDVIRHNIEAMKSLQDKLTDLENINSQLSTQLSLLNSEVDEVREPTDGEKLMAKKEVSYPFYLDLNDFWKGNWFEQQRENSNEKGIRQLPDGTYIADFDDLPTHNSMDIDSSFNSLV